MRVQVTPEAIRLVQEQGGQLYVWAKRSRCCHGSLTFLETSSEPRERPFRRVDADEIELYLDQSLGNPEELVIEAKGTSPQARARVLGRLRIRRLAWRLPVPAGRQTSNNGSVLGEADEPGLPLRSTPSGGRRAAIV